MDGILEKEDLTLLPPIDLNEVEGEIPVVKTNNKQQHNST